MSCITRRVVSVTLPVIAVGLLFFTVAYPASAMPLVFDFEDGEQGWEFFLGARRRETTVLGGSFAVFGSSNARIRLELDLTGLQTMTLEQYWVSEKLSPNLVALGVFVPGDNGGFVTRNEQGTTIDPNSPYLRAFDVSGFTGVGGVILIWEQLTCIPEEPCGPTRLFEGYVDNIRFHAIPEPRVGVLLGAATIIWVGGQACRTLALFRASAKQRRT